MRLGAAASAVIVALALASCSSATSTSSPTPTAFPGTALAKAQELVRRADDLHLQHADATTIADTYGESGGDGCTFETLAERQAAAPNVDRRFLELVVGVYCPTRR